MGKPKEWKGHGGVKSWEQASERSWSIWPGAYSPQAPWRPKGGKGMTRDQGIPGYATRKPQEEPPQSTALISAGGTSVKEGLVPTIQHALNCTRKAEAKVKKIQDDKEKHIQMWKTWEADMKAAWLREKKRFAAESERLEREAAESLQAQEDARCNLRAAFEGCYSNDAAATKAMEVEDADNNAEWEAMMAGWNQEAQPDWGSVLQRAYGDSTPVRRPLHPLTPRPQRPPIVPIPGPGPLAPVPSPACLGDPQARASLAATYDPYQAMWAGASPAPALPSGTAPPGLTPLTSTNGPSSVEHAAMLAASTLPAPEHGYGPSPIREKLNRRRASEPFGGKPMPSEPAPLLCLHHHCC